MKKRAVSLLLTVVLLLTLLPWGAVRASAASFTGGAALTPEEAVEIYARDKDVWMRKSRRPMYGQSYIFLDFDNDGVLELMSTFCDGSLRISSNRYFKIDLLSKTIYEIQMDDSMYNGELGNIDGGSIQLFRDKADNKLYYLMNEFTRIDWQNYYDYDAFVSLQDDTLAAEKPWGTKTVDGKTTYWYKSTIGNGVTASKAEYEAHKAEYLEGYEDLKVTLAYGDPEEIDVLQGDALKKELLKLYQGFSYQEPTAPFNQYIYRANYICDYPDGGGNELYFIHSLGYTDTPGRALAKSAQKNGYGDVATAWKALETMLNATDNPYTTVVDLQVKQKDVYMAILLDAFNAAVDTKAVKEASKFFNYTQNFADSVNTQMKAIHGIDLTDSEEFRKLDKNDLGKVQEFIDNQFKKEFSITSEISGIVKGVSKQINKANDFYSFIATLCSYVELYRMSDSMKEVLRELRENTPKDGSCYYLLQAIDECMKIISYSQEDFFAAIVAGEIVNSVGKHALKEVSGFFWGKVKTVATTYCPAVNLLLAGAKAGMAISNYMFDASATTEQYFKLLALLEVEGIVDDTLWSLQKKFSANKTELNAHTYLDAVDLRYKLVDMECDAAYNYVDKVDSTIASELMHIFDAYDFSNMKERIKTIQEGYQQTHRTICTSWISALEKDYPEIYPRYAPLLKAVQYPQASYKIACPVDVYVYDAGNRLVASVEQERSYGSENVTVSVENTVKCIDIYDEQQYKIVCRGYASGTMDVSIAAFANGEKIRTAQFYDLALTAGKTYEMTTKRNPSDKAAYTITPKQGSPIAADFDSLVTGGATYTVTVKNGYIATANGPANVWQGRKNENAELFAFVPKGYRFAGWKVSANSQCLSDGTNWQTTLRVPGENIVVEAVLERGSSYNPFLDVTESDWFYEHVMYAFNRNLVYGVDSTHFAPYKPMTRCQLVAILYRLEGAPAVSGSTAFTDLEKGQYYVDAVTWATQNGIVYGVSGTKFDPHGEVTRQQIVTFLYRYAQYKGADMSMTTSLNSFTDCSQLHDYARPAMAWAVANGVVYGTTNTTLSPLPALSGRRSPHF